MLQSHWNEIPSVQVPQFKYTTYNWPNTPYDVISTQYIHQNLLLAIRYEWSIEPIIIIILLLLCWPLGKFTEFIA